jgi:single-stranded-DNA-specific exonuclease
MTKSLLGKNWSLKSVNESQIQHMLQQHPVSELLSRLLVLRGVSVEAAQNFLNPKIRDFLPDPFHLKDMDKAVKRTIEAISSGQKICIFGDYDVDGATSSALLKRFFADIGVDVQIYIPDRIIEGYGPSVEAMHKIKASGASLVITVDCGAMAFEALAAAKEVGLDVIVLDHHMGGESLPEAVAVVNPNRLDETTEYRYLAAVGVSFLFIVGVSLGLDPRVSTDSRDPRIKSEGSKVNLLQYLDLVALGTVCDVMPLVGLNRAFVSQGLKVMAKRNNTGLRTLSDTARISTRPSCYHLGFVIGPRINAGGRVGRADLGSRLLSSNSEEEAGNISLELERLNAERRDIEASVLEEAIIMVERSLFPAGLTPESGRGTENPESSPEENLIFVAGQGWHPGVMGIVASRLKERYQKPVAVIALNDGLGKASCRSVRGVDFGGKIVEAKLQGLLEAGGGHAMAAGFTVLEDKIDELRSFLNESMAKEYQIFTENYSSEYEAEITTSGLTLDMVREMHKLAPFGAGNYEPMIRIDELFVLQAKALGQKHVSCLLAPTKTSYGGSAIRAIAFNCLENPLGRILMSSIPEKISVIGYAQINEWQDRENVQIVIQDVIIG